MKFCDFSFNWNQIKSNGIVIILSLNGESGHDRGTEVDFLFFEGIKTKIKLIRVQEVDVFYELYVNFLSDIFGVESDGILFEDVNLYFLCI